MKKIFLSAGVLILLLSAVLFSGCSTSDTAGEEENGEPPEICVLVPEASGESCASGSGWSFDCSHSSDGYVMAAYTGSADQARVQITSPAGTTFTYPLLAGDYETFPLQDGAGNYSVTILEHAYDDFYAVLTTQNVNYEPQDEMSPFLYPNRYVWFTPESDAVAKASELASESGGRLSYLKNVYHYVTRNITYDNDKAANVPQNYVPDIDETLSSGKGICFDYASLMSAMLRCAGIPTRLQVGYSGTAYHAWISVWLEETGWVDNVIEFTGTDWVLIDPTYAASNSASDVKKYIGDGSNYTVKYNY